MKKPYQHRGRDLFSHGRQADQNSQYTNRGEHSAQWRRQGSSPGSTGPEWGSFREKKLPTFKKGDGTSFQQFLTKFEMVAWYNHWPFQDRGVQVSLSLEGDALETIMVQISK